jgi:hypothetical protein
MPKKWKAHTTNDQRYKRANKVRMVKCTHCVIHTLQEIRSEGKVWAICTHCKRSGESEKIIDNPIHTWLHVVTTFTDANPIEEEEEE